MVNNNNNQFSNNLNNTFSNNFNNNNQFNNNFNSNCSNNFKYNNQLNNNFNNNNQFRNDFNDNNNKTLKNNYPNFKETKELSPLNIDEVIKVSKMIKNLDYESLCEKSDNPIYDLVIDIKTILDLEKGWKITFNGNDENKQRILKKFDERNFVISVIGNSNKGKTYMLNITSDFKEMKEGGKFQFKLKD